LSSGVTLSVRPPAEADNLPAVTVWPE